jgi:hypothetical protein
MYVNGKISVESSLGIGVGEIKENDEGVNPSIIYYI